MLNLLLWFSEQARGPGASDLDALGVGWEERLFHFCFPDSGAMFLVLFSTNENQLQQDVYLNFELQLYYFRQKCFMHMYRINIYHVSKQNVDLLQFNIHSYYVIKTRSSFLYFIHACKTLDLVINVSLITHPYPNRRLLVMCIIIITSNWKATVNLVNYHRRLAYIINLVKY